MSMPVVRPAILLGALVAMGAALAPAAQARPFDPVAPERAAPFGERVPAGFTNYGRVAPTVATVGRLEPAAVDAARALGFRRMIDLRQADEPGVAEAAARARAIGLERIHLPMPATAADIPAFMDRLTPLIEDAGGYPLLLACGSANRAAAAWALYRARTGVPARIAIEEGRAAGLTSREALVREVLGLPPLVTAAALP
jgi:uncharacterized protein (TIGR01244 family)